MYKVIPVPEKLFVGPDLYYVGILEKNTVFNVVYRDGTENFAYVKRFSTPKFIMEKEYRLFPLHKRSRILLLLTGEDKHARVSMVPSRRARSNVAEICFDDYLVKGPSAKGKRVATRVVRRVVESTDKVLKQRANMSLPGIADSDQEDQDPNRGGENGAAEETVTGK
jgi:topoisomerase-4 subunit A